MDNKMQPFYIKNQLENNKERRTFQHNKKEMLSVFQWKVRNRFIQRRQFDERKVRTY